ncbi:hypothetical protein K8P10_002683 [Leucobacter sp. Psy1]|uniref:sugar phosphate isomerase/epimerase family protein n=1 Tax=Leucobacter sp. Psy1 TaxID=2875729 RepID=UPI001CD51AE9|nr:sugar phosphate isomerase/epimerase family protein [Leucobacter sp. Psy1]UBH07172.1 hypothetical protein K8P10_002683 [Leucobacter sp. Psy1]
MSAPSDSAAPELTVSYVTLHGAGWAEPARNSFPARAAAAAAAGFTGIGSQLRDVFECAGGPAQVSAAAAESGLQIRECEFIDGWARPDEEMRSSVSIKRVGEFAQQTGLHHVTAGEFSASPLILDTASAHLAKIAAELDSYGVKIAVEPFPWGTISDYPTALEIVRRSGAANVGIMIDIWHYFNTGGHIGWLDDVDPGEITAVQLNDGPRVFRDFLHAARTTRALPGDGELDVRGLLQKLDDRAYGGPWCVEVNNPEFRELPVQAAADRAFAAASRVFTG